MLFDHDQKADGMWRKLGFLVYTGLAVVVGKDSLGVERKAYVCNLAHRRDGQEH